MCENLFARFNKNLTICKEKNRVQTNVKKFTHSIVISMFLSPRIIDVTLLVTKEDDSDVSRPEQLLFYEDDENKILL